MTSNLIIFFWEDDVWSITWNESIVASSAAPTVAILEIQKWRGQLRDQGKSRGGNINDYLAWWFVIVLKIKLLWLTLPNPT